MDTKTNATALLNDKHLKEKQIEINRYDRKLYGNVTATTWLKMLTISRVCILVASIQVLAGNPF